MRGNEAANCEHMSITVDTLGEIKEIKLKILAFFLECVVLSPSLYVLIQLFSSISVNSGF